jgi:hypothetical protein
VLLSDSTRQWKERASHLFELLAEHQELGLVVDGEHTGTSDTTENVSTSTLEERLDALGGNDLAGGIEGRLVLDGLGIQVSEEYKQTGENDHHIPHRRSSSCDDGWCPEGRKRYQHQW